MSRETIEAMRGLARELAKTQTPEERLRSAKVTVLLSMREETIKYLMVYHTCVEEVQNILGFTEEEATKIVNSVKDDIHARFMELRKEETQ